MKFQRPVLLTGVYVAATAANIAAFAIDIREGQWQLSLVPVMMIFCLVVVREYLEKRLASMNAEMNLLTEQIRRARAEADTAEIIAKKIHMADGIEIAAGYAPPNVKH